MTEMEFFVHPTAIIDPGVSIGSGTRIWHFSHVLSGSVIGERCVIGQNVMIAAGAVVTKDVPSFALMVGSPARFRGWVGRSGERLDADLVCPRTKERYCIRDGQLFPGSNEPGETAS